MNTPISINDVGGNVTVTIIDGSNNKTDIRIDDFENRFPQECGLTFLYNDPYKKDSNTSGLSDWLKGFQFNIKSVYYEKEYRREKLLNKIKAKLEQDHRLLLVGESGTSKSIILMEILCDFLKKGYKILHNLDPVSIGNSSAEIKNIYYIENTILKLVEAGKNVLVVVDNVHNKTISDIFSVLKRVRDNHNEDEFKKITFLLSARQPDFDLAMTGGGIFDSETKDRIDLLFDDPKRESIPYFSNEEVKGFIEKYREYWNSSLRTKSVEENTQEIFEDTKGHPIMVRFSVLKDGLKNHVRQMYQDWLLMANNYPNTERIKSIIACSLYDISSIPLTDESLCIDLDLENASLEIVDTIIKKNENSWTTIHPRWDLELFKYMFFSLRETDRTKIKKAFSFVLNKILDINSGSFQQLDILNIIYNTIAAEQFIDIKTVQEMIKVDEIERKLYPLFKPEFYNIIGRAYNKLKEYENAIIWFNKSLEANIRGFGVFGAYYNLGIALSALGKYSEAIEYYDKILFRVPKDPVAHYNKGIALSDLGKYSEAIECYDKAIEINPQYTDVYVSKGIAFSALGRMDAAIEYYDKAMEIDPKNADAYFGKGTALSDLGRDEEAIVWYDKAIEIDPQYVYAYTYKGSALSALGRNEEAITWFDKVLTIDPNHSDALNGKAFALAELDKNEEALPLIEKGLEIAPNTDYVLATAAFIMYNLGKYDDAKNYYNKALDINPNLKDILSESELKAFNLVMG